MSKNRKYYLYKSKIVSLPIVGTLTYWLQILLIRKNASHSVYLSQKPNPLKIKLLKLIDVRNNMIFKRSLTVPVHEYNFRFAQVILDYPYQVKNTIEDQYQLLWSVIKSSLITHETYLKNKVSLPKNLPIYKPEIEISCLLKSDSNSLQTRSLAGTERVFLNDMELLKKKYFNTKGYSREKKGSIERLYYPLLLVRIGRKFNQLLRIKNHVNLFFSHLADFIYTLHFVLKSKNSAMVIGYSTPLLALFRPKSTLIIMGNEIELPLYFLFKKRYEQATWLLCSQYLLKKMRGSYTLNTANIHLLYNAIDYNFFSPKKSKLQPSTKLKLLFASAWSPEKGLNLLLDALLLLPLDTLNKIELTIASSSKLWSLDFPVDNKTYLLELKAKIKRIPIIKNLNGVPYNRMPNLYRANHYLIFPSVWEEPFGLTALEAIACGTPVIAFSGGAVAEVVNSPNSVIVKQKSAAALAHAIQKAYQHHLLHSKQAHNRKTETIKLNPLMNISKRSEKLTTFIEQKLS